MRGLGLASSLSSSRPSSWSHLVPSAAATSGRSTPARQRLQELGFTGRIESTLHDAARPPARPEAGRTSAGCSGSTRSPASTTTTPAPGAIRRRTASATPSRSRSAIDNNGIVGPDRAGPRNMRRAPMVINTAFYPDADVELPLLRRVGRSVRQQPRASSSRRRKACRSPTPAPADAQAFIPPTERTEVAGFDFPGDNDAIRAEVLRRLNAVPGYRKLFGQVFPRRCVGRRRSRSTMFGRAIAEFEFSLTFANAPIDRYARGEHERNDSCGEARRDPVLRRGGCVSCHAVSGRSNEMFSDFREHVIGVPQLVPATTNNTFDGPGSERRLRTRGLHRQGGRPLRLPHCATPERRLVASVHARRRLHEPQSDHPPPLRRGCVGALLRSVGAGIAAGSATGRPVDPILALLDPLVATPNLLSSTQLDDLIAFVGDGLLDPRATPDNLRHLIPPSVPSGRPVLQFEFTH